LWHKGDRDVRLREIGVCGDGKASGEAPSPQTAQVGACHWTKEEKNYITVLCSALL